MDLAPRPAFRRVARSTLIGLLACGLLPAGPGSCMAQGEPGGAEAGAPQAPKPIVSDDGLLTIDRAGNRLIVVSEVCLEPDHEILEFALAGWNAKNHESLLHTKVTGQAIHFGLLTLGLRPGKPGEWIHIDTDRVIAIPPRGPALKLLARWTDKEGKAHERNIADWMAAMEGAKTPPPETFVFVGSHSEPAGGYLADRTGELVSVANFAGAVIDVPFESTQEDDAGRLFRVKRKALPPRGTKVELIIALGDGARKCPHARARVEIDGLGRLRADFKAISSQDLRDWAGQLVQEHPQAMVEVWAHADALVGDVQWVLDELKLGGVFDRPVYRMHREVEVPRTPDAARRRLADWAERFAEQDPFGDPATEAEYVLKALRSEMEVLSARRHLVEEYADDLENALKAYRERNPATDEEGDSDAPGEAE